MSATAVARHKFGSVEDGARLSELILDLQARGIKIKAPFERRPGGAGPSDAGMLWIEGSPVTVPVDASYVADSPYTLEAEDFGHGIYRDGVRVAAAMPSNRPKFYDLSTADGTPYWKLALMHLDSLASTVMQTCAYWGNDDQCRFCGIGVSLASGSTVKYKRPEQLAEVAAAAARLDGAVDITLTTGSTRAPDRGALHVARCGSAMKEASGLPVEVQFEPPEDLSVIDRVADLGIDSVGIHVESFDPAVLARVAPPKGRTGIERYFETWEYAVKRFGEGQVSTYVILGMGEDPELTVAACKRAVDIGVYPFLVPLRPVPGSLMADALPPPREYTERIARLVAPYLVERGLTADKVTAGCARCQACSAVGALEQTMSLSGAGSKGRRVIPIRS
ncbi:MSMEG_0568 family radical SAM protein [Paraburkholderia hospita]|uniref:MSMEG_0568 family radical SAM protein n=1 Tax=Paraburkholderia hospita TaxID=169430 RepID=UPI0002E2D78D|nr:MSMEG_0568 family radical SAM protein [Paraburkholderia hospita]